MNGIAVFRFEISEMKGGSICITDVKSDMKMYCKPEYAERFLESPIKILLTMQNQISEQRREILNLKNKS